MREILFRGKHKGPRKWVEGSLVDYGDGDFDICVKSGAPGMLYKFHVYPETVGQYTGLTDKNGVKIFEGDIIRIRFELDSPTDPGEPISWYDLANVVYSTEHYGWYAAFADGEELSMWEYDDPDDVEIVGNIHDNPELLGGKP